MSMTTVMSVVSRQARVLVRERKIELQWIDYNSKILTYPTGEDVAPRPLEMVTAVELK
jgi:hypothetical protein